MSKYTKEQLRTMARQYIETDDFVRKMQLMVTMQMITGLRQGDIELKIQGLAK